MIFYIVFAKQIRFKAFLNCLGDLSKLNDFLLLPMVFIFKTPVSGLIPIVETSLFLIKNLTLNFFFLIKNFFELLCGSVLIVLSRSYS